MKNESRDVALQIQLKEIVKVLVHFGKGLPVIFLYTLSKCGVYIRKALEMEEGSGLNSFIYIRINQYSNLICWINIKNINVML